MTAAGKLPVSWNFTTMPSEEWKNGVGSALTMYAADQTDANWANVVSAFVDGWATEYALANGLTFFNIREHVGFLRNMIVRTTEAGNVMLIVCFYHEDAEARTALLNAVAEKFPQITSLYYVINGKANDSIGDQECVLYKGEDAIYEYMEGLKFKIGPKSFYQTNTKQAYKLYSVTREFADLTGSEVVYDLYTGTGTIAQFVSSKASKVIGIEYVPEAIEDAEINAAANNITNCDFYAGDMKDILTDAFVAEHGRPDVIILDPPRAGIHPDVAKVILNAAPERMVYVSCNPASQARDLEILCTDYEITAVRPVDMFPHTHHVENVVALKRRS
jgi:23S rRNA (uracil1939-C5)-methyltransferase